MQNKATIICPNCKTEISIEDALYAQLESQFNKDIQAKREQYKKAQLELQQKAEALKKEQEQFEDKLQDALTLRMKAKEQDLRESIQKEVMQIKEQEEALLKAELDKKNKQLLSVQQEAEQKLQEALKQSKKEQQAQIKAQLEQESALKVKELEDALQIKSAQIQELEASKAEITKLKMEMAEAEAKAKSEAQIEFYQKLAEEKQKAIQEVNSQNELKLKEADEKMRQLQEQLQIAQRKAEQGSMQTQGEVQELAIEEYLSSKFPLDTIEEIKKGQRGADCMQIVNTPEFANCGKIYYESKRTKEFQKSWIEKFKADMREKGADVGVLITAVLPKELERMGFYDGIWVCTYDEFKGSVALIRNSLIQVSLAKLSQEGKSDKMTLLYNYLTSNEFAMQVEAIVEGFTTMQSDLQKEKNAMARMWKQREKQLEKVLDNTIGMYGSIKGIAGNAIGNVKALELEYISDEEEK
jgi:hypothetical protein